MSAIQVGQYYSINGTPYLLRETRFQHQKVVFESDAGDLHHMSPDDFRRCLCDGVVKPLIERGGHVFEPVDDAWRLKESIRSAEERTRRKAILGYEEQARKKGETIVGAADGILQLCIARNWKVPSARTLRNWRRLGRQHESQLTPNWRNCGNRRQGPDGNLLQAIDEVLRSTAHHDRFTISGAWQLIEARYHELCGETGEPPRRHTKRKLETYLKGIGWAPLVGLRLDGRTASAITRVAVERHSAAMIWQQVEIDASVLDVRVRDENGVDIGRPLIYAAVDVCSGYVVGFHMTLLNPSVLPFIECLRYMFFPKPEGFDAQYQIKNRIEAFGKPSILKVDNGSEFVGKQATEIVRNLMADMARCRPYKPTEKPMVERFFGVLKEFVRTLPGSTISAVHNDKRKPPAHEKLLTLEELKGRVLRFIYDDYALKTSKSRSEAMNKAVAPHDIWQEMSSTYLGQVPISREEFDRCTFYKKERRVLGRDGISLHGIFYNSPELTPIYHQFPRREVDILYSEMDLRVIYVIAPDDQRTVAAMPKNKIAELGNLPTVKEAKAQVRRDGEKLNQRAQPNRLAELKTHEVTAKTGKRATGKGARKLAALEETLDSARQKALETMPAGARRREDPSVLEPTDSFDWDDVPVNVGRLLGEK